MTPPAPALRMPPLAFDALAALETPCYVYDPATVVSRYIALREALGTRLIVSLKANSDVDLFIRCAHAFIDGVELASLGELEVVVARLKTAKYVNNPAMSPAFLRAAVVSRCSVIVDNVAQAELLARANSKNAPTEVLLRLNAAACYRRAGLNADGGDHFGMTPEDASTAGRMLAAAGCNVSGAHLFAGSQTFRSHGLRNLDALAAVLPMLETGLGFPLARINVGGGFPDDWEAQPEELRKYRSALAPLAARYTLTHEAGRAIYGWAGTFVTRVVGTKVIDDRYIVMCDGGMNHNFLLARTESVYKNYAAPIVVSGPTRERTPRNQAQRRVQFVGNTCSRHDTIGLARDVERLPQPNDFCVFQNSGAYNQSYTVAPFLKLQAARSYVLG